MMRKLAIVAGLATLLGIGVAVAGTPFGGDDGGFIPPDKATLVCESAVGKAAPEVKGTDQDGKHFKLSDYKGKVVLLDFWSEF